MPHQHSRRALGWSPRSVTLVAGLAMAAMAAPAAGTQPETSPPAPPATTPELPPELQPLDLVRPTLPENVAAEVAELEARIAELEALGLSAPTREEQDAAMDEAITLAERVLVMRVEQQGNLPAAPQVEALVRWRDSGGEPVEWYEVIDARLKSEHLHRLRGLDAAARAELATLMGSDAEVERLYGAGEYAEAEPLYEQALAMRQRIFPGDHPHVALSLSNLGFVRHALGRPGEAEPLFEQTLAMHQRLFTGDHPDVAVCLNNLASLRIALGRAREAEPLYEQALAMFQRFFPGDHPDVALSLGTLARVRQDLGRAREAEPLYEQALAMRQRLFPGDHPDVAYSLANLAGVREALGRAGGTEPLLEQALAMHQRLFPGDHPAVATSLNSLAGGLYSLGRAGEAEPLFEQALAMQQRIFPGDHPDVADSLANLAGVRGTLGRAGEADPLLEQALAMRQRIFPGDHPDVALSMETLAFVRHALGRAGEAEPLFEQTLAMHQRLFTGDHPDVANSLKNLAGVRSNLGRAREAEPLYEQALAMAERMRTEVRGSVEERAQFAGRLDLPGTAASLARVRVELGTPAEALGVLERGRGRAGLDLFAGGRSAAEVTLRASADADSLARYDGALAAEEQARLALAEAENRLSKVPDDQKAEWAERVRVARATLSESTASAFNELRGLVPVLDPLASGEVLAALRPGEALVTWSWTEAGIIALVARDGRVTGAVIARTKDEATALAERLAALRGFIASRPVGATAFDDAALAAVRDAVLPVELRSLLEGASGVIAVTDGPVAGIPVELLLDRPVTYAPSATIALRPRLGGAPARAMASRGGVIVGDPVFAGSEARPEPDYPETGVLLAMVVEGNNGAQAGLQRGDVLMAYNGAPLNSAADLRPAVEAASEQFATRGADAGERPVPATVWRATPDGTGETVEVMLAPGRLGVQLDPAPPAEGLRSMAVLSRSSDALAAEAAQLEQVRFYGLALKPLHATRLEASAVAAMLGEGATLLLGPEATAPKVRAAVASTSPRIIHLATHGLLGNARDPLLASVALTSPEEPTRDDTGFLTLEDILATWGGQLRGVELVTLSACDTGRGFQQGDTVMGLPLGLLVGGADSVLVSLWNVDDNATALLMARFYSNWLGQARSQREIDGVAYSPGQPMPKLAALREAQAWLRELTRDQADAALAGGGLVEPGESRPRNPERAQVRSDPGDLKPYAHPHYWAAFILIGNPE